MPLFLSTRDTESRELMDDPGCDHGELLNTYRQFGTINSMISGWKQIYKRRIKPNLHKNKSNSLLDIGFGGGDIPIKIAQWARDDGLKLDITAIETDRRAFNFVQQMDTPSNVTFKHCSSTDLAAQDEQFNFVISNHLLHHLGKIKFQQILDEAKQLSTTGVIFNDLARSDIGYALFNIFSRPVFQSSFITHDGLTSIRRSYTVDELRSAVPAKWIVEKQFPFRLLLRFQHRE
jgi:2-polyprenyl-3-methyl-5-hydroxy-6-metoxy-1,4-benzoquinol methylase